MKPIIQNAFSRFGQYIRAFEATIGVIPTVISSDLKKIVGIGETCPKNLRADFICPYLSGLLKTQLVLDSLKRISAPVNFR